MRIFTLTLPAIYCLFLSGCLGSNHELMEGNLKYINGCSPLPEAYKVMLDESDKNPRITKESVLKGREALAAYYGGLISARNELLSQAERNRQIIGIRYLCQIMERGFIRMGYSKNEIDQAKNRYWEEKKVKNNQAPNTSFKADVPDGPRP